MKARRVGFVFEVARLRASCALAMAVALAGAASAASCSDSFYLVLREIANSGEVARVDTDIAMRDCVGALLKRLCPAP